MTRITVTRERGIYFAVLAAATAVFYTLNVLTPLKPDDIMYALEMGNVRERVTDVASLFRSQAYHYIDNNGRFANFIGQLFCSLLGKPFFNVCNAAVAAVMAHCAARLVCRSRRSGLALALVLAWVMTLMPVPGETMLWLDGSANYLWTAASTLALLVWLTSGRATQPAPWWRHAVVLLLTLLAGAMNESITAGTALGMAIYFALNPSQFRSTARTAMVGYLLGVAIIFASPGAWYRLLHGEVNLHLTIQQMLTRRALNTATKSLHFVTPAIAMVSIAVAIVRRRWSELRGNLVLWCFVGVTLAMVALSVTTSYRSYTGFALLSFVLVAQWVHRTLESHERSRQWVAVALVLLCGVLTLPAVRDVSRYKRYDDAVIAAIKSAPRECVLPASQSPVNSRWVFPAVYDNDGYFSHKFFYCIYYDKDDLQFLAPDIYARYTSGDLLRGGVASALACTDSTFSVDGTAPAIMQFAGHPYSIVDMGTTRPMLSDTHARVYYDSMEEHLGAERSARLKRWGEFPEYMPVPMYYLRQGTHYYLVLPALDSDTRTIEVPLTIDGKPHNAIFQKATQSTTPQ